MKKGHIRQLLAAVLILCTLFGVNLSFDSISRSIMQVTAGAFVQQNPEQSIETENTSISGVDVIGRNMAITTQGFRGNGTVGAVLYRRNERRSQSILYIIMAVLFKTSVMSCLIYTLIQTVFGRRKTVRYQILAYIHRKDGKKRQDYFI